MAGSNSTSGHLVDLHSHSTFSDGLLSPADLVATASRRRIRVLALTDHDTLEGIPEAVAASKDAGIEFIPGVELSAEAGSFEIHILGYFVNPNDSILTAALADNAVRRVVRTTRIIERLEQIGFPLSFERVQELAGEGTIGRPHIARAMIESGYVDSVSEAFGRFLGIGRSAFVPRARSRPEDAVRLLREANAVPVLAHPLSTGDIEGTLRALMPAGLLGIEVYYGEYSPEIHTRLQSIADSWMLVATGGSDYHGPGFKEGRELGSAPVPRSSVDQLRRSYESLMGNSPFSR